MKRLLALAIFAVAFLSGSCYDDYVKDHDHTSIYIAYQYDLRTFVVGEGMNFDVGAVLGGVIDNRRDRRVRFSLAPELLTDDLSVFEDDPDVESYTAFSKMSDPSSAGMSQAYVASAITASGIAELTPLPEACYSLSDPETMTIRAGRYSGTITVQADSLAFLADPHASVMPYYALAFRLEEADADVVLRKKCFSIVAVRYENMMFGNWWYGGVTTVKDDATGETLERRVYPTTMTTANSVNRVCELTTAAPLSVTTSRMGDYEGSLRLDFDGGEITVSDAAGVLQIEPFDEGSRFNGAKLLQNRKLFLNYRFAYGDGTTTFVQDTLTFRNRIRDGVNEWQDENPEHYK